MNNRFSSLSRPVLWLFVVLIPFFSKAQSVTDSLPPVDSLTDWEVNDFARQFAAQANTFEKVLLDKSQAASGRRTSLEENWNLVKADSTTSKLVLDSVAGLLKIAKNDEKNAARQRNQAAKTLELANKTVESDNVTQRKNLRKLWKETRQLNEMVNPPAPKVAAAPAEQEPKMPKREKKKKASTEEAAVIPAEKTGADSIPPATRPPSTANRPPSTVYKKYDPADDVMLHPPALPCQMAVTTRDEFSGEIYRRSVGVELFRQSPPALKNFLQGKPNVLCEAAIASAGANIQLHLTFTINDPNPRKAFGKLDKDSPATLWFMDGSSFILNNRQVEEGVLNPETQAYVIHAQYTLNSEVFRKMRRMELDKLRIVWSSGYEDYDVHYVTLLMDQAKCFSE